MAPFAGGTAIARDSGALRAPATDGRDIRPRRARRSCPPYALRFRQTVAQFRRPPGAGRGPAQSGPRAGRPPPPIQSCDEASTELRLSYADADQRTEPVAEGGPPGRPARLADRQRLGGRRGLSSARRSTAQRLRNRSGAGGGIRQNGADAAYRRTAANS